MINSFRSQYNFLSNFYIEPDGTCVEVEYQMAKCQDQKHLFTNVTPKEAKRLGRSVKLIENWEEIKLDIMYQLVKKKFMDHSVLRYLLAQTKNELLVEENNWGDDYWGTSGGRGANHLGNILMRVRSEVK